MIHVLALCPEAAVLGRGLAAALGARLHVHQNALASDGDEVEVFSRIAERMAELWPRARALVVIAPAGVVVRGISPLAVGKHRDPAVVCCDVLGRWAIPLLCGHEGGGNDLAFRVGNLLAAEPVITTTSEALRDHIVGVGCRRGATGKAIVAAIQEALRLAGVTRERVRLLATAAQKATEPGVLEAAKTLELPLRIIAHEEIRACAKAHGVSAAARRQLDLPAVAEPCALLAGRRTTICLAKQVIQSVTVAVAQEHSIVWASDQEVPSIERVEQKRRSMEPRSS